MSDAAQVFEAASTTLKKAAQGSSAETLSKRRGIEAKYGQAYQGLVSAGEAPQIRAKYRA